MRGAIVGDILGSAFINSPQVTNNFQLLKPFSAYTDDTVLTISTADAILKNISYKDSIKEWTKKYPKAGYQSAFLEWALGNNPKEVYKSNGDGAARRVSPIGFAADSIEYAMIEAEKATIITHPTESKVKASQAYCGAIYLAKTGHKKTEIRDFLYKELGYQLPEKLSKDCAIKLNKRYESPVPCAIMAVLVAHNFEEAIRNAIWLDGPRNTISSIAGAVAQAYYKHIPKSIIRKSLSRLAPDLELVLSDFEDRYCDTIINNTKEEIKFNFH
ncbi:ADP-ribosylglycohydrolase family protein [Carboxylicivirga sp. M1479]|uniref:ADP-ribosylglycohydrolase family protein n=1 Tax=Carboxylicivirga sp. M1479 TaxID=2594476 RepID=UPI001178479C|nr:ADP-ribosylglycohydrolase family protein [Carboxylicivirga sp. M1479]TRX71068.1 hypothetical protein FNN09_08640 [Carboxylicivirga sp. M1479]